MGLTTAAFRRGSLWEASKQFAPLTHQRPTHEIDRDYFAAVGGGLVTSGFFSGVPPLVSLLAGVFSAFWAGELASTAFVGVFIGDSLFWVIVGKDLPLYPIWVRLSGITSRVCRLGVLPLQYSGPGS